jgi:two-component system KDP operon response regulator KdpE
MRLLLIEDDETTVESIRLCLEIYETNSSVIATAKGKDALLLLRDKSYDAVLIDLGLPDIDGTEVITKMREFTQIPAVVLSARHSPEVIARALELGADDYITKPFDYRNLLNRLKHLIDQTRRKSIVS